MTVTRGTFGVFLCLGTALVSAEDWPHWRGQRQDGTWNAPPLPDRWPETGPPTLWKKPLGAGYSGISVVGDSLFTMDRPRPTDKSKTPDGQERVVCLDAQTGETRWTWEYDAHYGDLDYGSGPRSNPTVHDGRLYILGAVGTEACLDAQAGSVIWRRDLRAEEKAQIPMWGLAASPLVDGDNIILHTGLPGGSVVALDRATGKERWRALEDPAGYATPIMVDRPQGRQLIVWTPTHVRSLDPSIGIVFWSVPYPVTYGVSIATPIYHEDIVFVSGYWEGSKAIKLGATSAEHTLVYTENRWLRGLMCPPLYRDGKGFLLDKQHGLTCFHFATGEKIWDDGNKMTLKDRNPQASLVWANQGRRVVGLNSEGEVILARLEDDGYKEDARHSIIEPTWANPAFAGDSIYARSDTSIVRVKIGR